MSAMNTNEHVTSGSSKLIEELSSKNHRLLDVLPRPDPQANESEWYDLYSPESFRLTLYQVLNDCKLPHKNLLEAFPYSEKPAIGDATNRIPPPCPSRVNVDSDTLSSKILQLEALMKLYENHIQWLSTDSRLHLGELKGCKVAILVETSDQLFEDKEFVKEYKRALSQFIEEQLAMKEAVHLIQFGSAPIPDCLPVLPFSVSSAESVLVACEWVSSLAASGGCDLMGALNMALALEDLDTVMVVLSTQPNQDMSVIKDYMVDTLSAANSPKLHLVAYHCSSDHLKTSLSQIAKETHGHFHSISITSSGRGDGFDGGDECDGVGGDGCDSGEECDVGDECSGDGCDGGDEEERYKVENSDIDFILEWVEETRTAHQELCNLKSGMISDGLMDILREFYLSTEWAEDFPCQRPLTGNHCIPCTSQAWLEDHGIASNNLNLYHFLTPYAYARLEEHVEVIDRTAVSQVYEVMPLFRWHDSTYKHLNVSVHNFEGYINHLENYLSNSLQPRLNWLLSGSLFPLGVVTESRVLVAVDCTHVILPHVLLLQQHLKMLLEEQLVYLQQFNLLRFGKECCLWRSDFNAPTHDNLVDSWEWIMGMSPSGTSDLLAVLKTIFESGEILSKDNADDENIGIYLILSAVPNQENDVLCSYLEQQLTGSRVHLHVVYYNTETSSDGLVIPGRESGRYGSECETEGCFKELAKTGRGRFHHFRVSGVAVSDDIDLIMAEVFQAKMYLQMMRKILDDYREFCRRNVPPPPLLVSSTSPKPLPRSPPLYPRQTTSSLARMNACHQRMSNAAAESTARAQGCKPPQGIKTRSYYTGRGLNKVTMQDYSLKASPSKVKKRSLIPSKEEYISSKQWLSKYSLDKLGLSFARVVLRKSGQSPPKSHGVTYKHINHQGEVVDLGISHKRLKSYASQLQTAINRYRRRMEWLQRDDHRLLGTLIERDIMILIDVSSSVTPHWPGMKERILETLEMFPPKVKSFNSITYASSVCKFTDHLVPTNQDNMTQAKQWLESVKTGGCSCFLEAVKVSIQSGANGIYLVTDGVANHTHQFLLNQIPSLRQQHGDHWRLNTVAFHCTDSQSQSFLQDLAHSTGGRYHCYDGESDVSSDDTEQIHKETMLAQSYLQQTNNFLH